MGTLPCPSLRSLLEHNSTLHQRLPPVEELTLQRLISSLMAPDTELGFLKEVVAMTWLKKRERSAACLWGGQASPGQPGPYLLTVPLDQATIPSLGEC